MTDLFSAALGFVLVANFYLLPGAAGSPRVLDALGFVLWLVLAWRLMGRGARPVPLVTLILVNLAPIGWLFFARMSGLRPTMLLSLRWILAIAVGYQLHLFAENRRQRTLLIWGMWWGLALNVLVLLLQSTPLGPLTYRTGLAAADSVMVTFNKFFERNPGMHGHANASAAVVSLILPLGLYLYYRGAARLWLPVASLVLLLASGHITSSRSPLIIAAASFVIVALSSRRLMRSLVLATLLATMLVPAWLVFGPPGGKVRWADTTNMTLNSSDRLASNRAAIEIASENVLGLGVRDSQYAMQRKMDNPASHNAFLHMAIVYGPGFALVLAVMMLSLSWHALQGVMRPWGLEAMLAIHMTGLFFFEEHLNNPTFIVLVSWLATASVTRFTTTPADVPHRVPAPAPPPGEAGA